MSLQPHTSVPLRYSACFRAAVFPSAPFHFDGTFCKPSHFPTPLYRWSPGRFHQTMRIGGRLLGVKLKDAGTRAVPKLNITLFCDSPLPGDLCRQAIQELMFRYALEMDLRQFRRVVYTGAEHKAVFRRWMGTRPSTPYSLYELLVVGLVLQNTQVRRSVQMLETLVRRFGTRVTFDSVTVDALWPPDALETSGEDDLRALKIGYRARALDRFSRQFAAGAIDEQALRRFHDIELNKALLSIYGVGPETARILMTEAFHRHADFDHIAPWQQKILSRLLSGRRMVPVEKIIRDAARRYGRFTHLAMHYLWEDLFWQRRSKRIEWLESEIRL